jgi:hypothetical protein
LASEDEGAITRRGAGGLTEVEREGETVRRAARPFQLRECSITGERPDDAWE